MSICAYCKQDRKATREHVIPDFIYRFQEQLGQTVIGWNEVAQKMISDEHKVKDVCAVCNNGVLSDLDCYGKQLLVNSGLFVKNYTKTSLALKYDYSLLLRWLLKISFNSSRADNIHAPIFNEFIPFILGSAPLPPRYRVATILSLASPEILGASSISSGPFFEVAEGSKRINPFLVRISYGAVSSEIYILRVNIFGPAVFQLLFFQNNVLPGHAAATIRSYLKDFPKAVELTSKRSVISVAAGNQTWLDLYRPQIMRAAAIR